MDLATLMTTVYADEPARQGSVRRDPDSDAQMCRYFLNLSYSKYVWWEERIAELTAKGASERRIALSIKCRDRTKAKFEKRLRHYVRYYGR